jgi:hypothetical protein
MVAAVLVQQSETRGLALKIGRCGAILFCPPGYGPRPDEPQALLMPSTGLLEARPFVPRPLRESEADASTGARASAGASPCAVARRRSASGC